MTTRRIEKIIVEPPTPYVEGQTHTQPAAEVSGPEDGPRLQWREVQRLPKLQGGSGLDVFWDVLLYPLHCPLLRSVGQELCKLLCRS